MPIRNQRGVAKWVKILLWTIVVLLILSLATCTIGGIFLFKGVNEATDPKKVAAITNSMMTLADPLPEKYKMQVGMDCFNSLSFKFVCIKDKEAVMEYYIVMFKNSENREYTAKQFVTELSNKKNIPSGAGTASEAMKGFTAKEQITMKAAGRDVPCAVGVTENSVQGQKRPALFGCIIPEKSRILLLCAFGPEGTEELNKTAVSEFFALIKSVN